LAVRSVFGCDYFLRFQNADVGDTKLASITLTKVDQNLRAAGCTRGLFALVCNLKPSTFSAMFSGVVNLGGEREAELLTVSHRLVELREACEPFALPSDADAVRVLVQRFSEGSLTTEMIRAAVATLFSGGIDSGKF
jgi:hypothetical protein